MTTLWRVGWTDEDGETIYSIPLDSKQAVGELCKSVESFPQQLKTADVWIEHGEIEWNKITGSKK